jgi:hypothetical protein
MAAVMLSRLCRAGMPGMPQSEEEMAKMLEQLMGGAVSLTSRVVNTVVATVQLYGSVQLC